MESKPNKTITELNEDCEILIKKEIQKYLIDLTKRAVSASHRERKEMYTRDQMHPTQSVDRSPKMLSSNTSSLDYNTPMSQSKMSYRKSFEENMRRRHIDMPIQTADDKFTAIPRSTMLSRTRQHLCKRNSGAQSQDIKFRTAKTQTETCAKTSISITAEPMDFLGLYEKGTNVPVDGRPGVLKEKATQMYEHITQSELFCIEWIHKYLFQVKLNPNTLVVDDKIRDSSESACVT